MNKSYFFDLLRRFAKPADAKTSLRLRSPPDVSVFFMTDVAHFCPFRSMLRGFNYIEPGMR